MACETSLHPSIFGEISLGDESSRDSAGAEIIVVPRGRKITLEVRLCEVSLVGNESLQDEEDVTGDSFRAEHRISSETSNCSSPLSSPIRKKRKLTEFPLKMEYGSSDQDRSDVKKPAFQVILLALTLRFSVSRIGCRNQKKTLLRIRLRRVLLRGTRSIEERLAFFKRKPGRNTVHCSPSQLRWKYLLLWTSWTW